MSYIITEAIGDLSVPVTVLSPLSLIRSMSDPANEWLLASLVCAGKIPRQGWLCQGTQPPCFTSTESALPELDRLRGEMRDLLMAKEEGLEAVIALLKGRWLPRMTSPKAGVADRVQSQFSLKATGEASATLANDAVWAVATSYQSTGPKYLCARGAGAVSSWTEFPEDEIWQSPFLTDAVGKAKHITRVENLYAFPVAVRRG